MYLNRRVGTPSAPADPSLLPERAQRLFDFAVRSSGCATPVIALNELFGAQLDDAVVGDERALPGERPAVGAPAGGAGCPAGAPALDVTRTRAATRRSGGVRSRRSSDLVLEKYFSAAAVARAGPVLGNRRMRTSMRRSASTAVRDQRPALTRGGHARPSRHARAPADGKASSRRRDGSRWPSGRRSRRARSRASSGSRTSGPGAGAPTTATVQTRTSRRGVRLPVDARPAPLRRAGVTRRRRSTPTSREGQIDLPAGMRCAYGDAVVRTTAIGELRSRHRRGELALSALYGRLVESREAGVRGRGPPGRRARRRPRALRGGRGAYLAALTRDARHRALARGVLADELRRAELEARLRDARSDGGRDRALLRHLRAGARARGGDLPGAVAGCRAAAASSSRPSRRRGSSSRRPPG